MMQTAADRSQAKPRLITTGRYSPAGLAVRILLTCWIVYALHFATNTVREIFPALSLGDRLSFDVSEYAGLHPDIFELPGRGVFINNNPGASILAAVPYALTRPVIDYVTQRVEAERAASGAPIPEYDSVWPMAREFYRLSYERGYDVKFGLAAGVMQALLMAPLSALSAVVMLYILLSLGVSRQAAALLALLYAFATPVFYRTAQLNHNLLEGHFALFAFALLWQPWNRNEQRGRWTASRYVAAGILAGWTVVLDYSGLLIVLGLGLYAIARWIQKQPAQRRWTDLMAFGVGVSISLAVLLGYQWAAFGSPFYPAQHYMPPTTFSGYGYQGMDWPKLDLLWENSFGMRYGLFTSAPLLALALILPAWLPRARRLVPNLETALIVFLTVALFLFTAANQFSRMQFNTGVRHLVPVTPFLFLLAAGVLLRLPRRFTIPFSLLAVYWSWALAMYRDVELGRGIYEAVIQITLGGPRLPWMATLERLGFLPPWISPFIVLLLAALVIALVWFLPLPEFWPGRGWLWASKSKAGQAS